jgi:hypothetical protein
LGLARDAGVAVDLLRCGPGRLKQSLANLVKRDLGQSSRRQAALSRVKRVGIRLISGQVVETGDGKGA